MSIYVCFDGHMICLYDDYKVLSKMYPTLQTPCDLVKNWLRYSLICVEAAFIIYTYKVT